MTPEQYEAEALTRALEGDAEAGMEVIGLCITALLDQGRMPDRLRYYLANCLNKITEGIPSDRALCIEVKRERGKPANPFPEWQQHLGALAALLSKRKYGPQQIAVALCDQRRAIHDLTLDEADAHRIRIKWEPMQRIDSEEMLIHLAGPYWKILSEYPPRI